MKILEDVCENHQERVKKRKEEFPFEFETDKLMRVKKNTLSWFDINNIRMELVKGMKRLDYYFLDDIFVGLEFFKKSNLAIRKEIITTAVFKRYG